MALLPSLSLQVATKQPPTALAEDRFVADAWRDDTVGSIRPMAFRWTEPAVVSMTQI